MTDPTHRYLTADEQQALHDAKPALDELGELELDRLRAENERLEAELKAYDHTLDEAYAERDTARDRVAELEGPSTQEQIIAVGKALLPYLRDDLSDIELGTAVHDATVALRGSKAADK